MERTVGIGFLPKFKGSDTLLLASTAAALDPLANLALALSATGSPAVAVHLLPYVTAHGVSLEAKHSDTDLGIRRTGNHFTWLRSSDGWRAIHELILSLRGSTAAHQYLDGPADEVTVMLSVGQYGEEVWQRAG